MRSTSTWRGSVSDLGWRAEGIERALACGGVVLETYHRPGFAGTIAVRRSAEGGAGGGFSIEADPEPGDDEEEE